MGQISGIAWTHSTFNPWWGCDQISPACDNCYAMRDAHRYLPGRELWNGNDRRTFGARHWYEPLKWDKKAAKEGRRQRVFCASMADVFDNKAPVAERERLWNVIEKTPHLDWLLLTKRIGNARDMLPSSIARLPNVWLGITVVTQKEADRDIPKLLDTVIAGPRWLSIEPMLEPINLNRLHSSGVTEHGGAWDAWQSCLTGRNYDIWADGETDGWPRIDWVVVGGESGPRARPMLDTWALDVRQQCLAAGVPFFFKQQSQVEQPATFKDFATFPPELQVREFPRV